MSNNTSPGQGPHRRFDNRPKFGSDGDLLTLLRGLEGKTYGAYQGTAGQWDYGSFKVIIDRVQADPYAPPSSVRIVSTPKTMGLPREAVSTADQALATSDFLIRAFARVLKSADRYAPLSIARPSQEILERSAAHITPSRVELRIQVQLPARGRSILGLRAAEIFDLDLPEAVNQTFNFVSPESASYLEDLLRHIRTLEDHCALQGALAKNKWVGFIANGAVLPRRTGISQAPLEGAVPFKSPETLLQTVTLPHAGEVEGMAIPPGITVIVGGGYHGKSTLLSALERGVYPHVPGDGRELVAALPDAMKIRAADGRPVTKVDVSPFINHLPTGADTRVFSTQNASGSTSQAASIIEALGMRSPLLLIDEDTSATNLMIRDDRMRKLVSPESEPITPLVDRIQALAGGGSGTSLVLVMGGSGAYLDVADRVLQMSSYHCEDVTNQARAVVEALSRPRTDLPDFPSLSARAPLRLRGGGAGKPKTRTFGLEKINLDRQTIDVSDVEQIVDPGQTEAIAWALRGVLQTEANARKPLADLLRELEKNIDEDGLDYLTRFGVRKYPAFLARPRAIDVAAAINRYRLLEIT